MLMLKQKRCLGVGKFTIIYDGIAKAMNLIGGNCCCAEGLALKPHSSTTENAYHANHIKL